MESVEQIIEYILDQSRFDLGHAETARGHSSRSWASRPGEVISTDELRQLLRRNDSGALGPDGVKEARLICPEGTISLLVEHLRVLLNDYVDAENETIGHAFPKVSLDYANETTTLQADGLSTMSCITGLEALAGALVKGSALVGSPRVGSLLADWVEGRPVQYRTCAVLNGINVKAPLEPVAGIRIAPLPWSSDDLPDDLPLPASSAPEDYLGRTVICVDTMATPALFRPGPDGVRCKRRSKNVPAGRDLALRSGI